LKDSPIISFAGENFDKFDKDRIKHARNNHCGHKSHPVNGSEAGNQFRRDEESVEKAKEFQPLDLAQRPNHRWIHKKVHEV
jgi:hypothetical protein